MAEEKKEGKLVQETPEMEKPPVLSPETRMETPPEAPAPVFKEMPENTCQWFMDGREFCDKIKKGVRCGGDVRKCPF